MANLADQVYEIQRAYHCMFDAQDQIPAYYDADDEEAINAYYVAVGTYESAKADALEMHRKFLSNNPDFQFYLKLLDPAAFQIITRLEVWMRYFG